ncbi:MAG: DUF4145 domain-containing protein [Pseudomonas sp.]|uniref:DUF4145 domain-containing protein n=1 Tax=Pseudomonas sp. TaxID=306 RepID=UPI0032425138
MNALIWACGFLALTRGWAYMVAVIQLNGKGSPMQYVAPEFDKKAFHCPHCGVYALMQWNRLGYSETGIGYNDSNYVLAYCAHCLKASLWARREKQMLVPDSGQYPLPEADMPEDVKTDYLEAAQIASKSPRGAAALLRLALQKLCVHLGEKGKHIYSDIKALTEKSILPVQVLMAADAMRLAGNNAVHPGALNAEDLDEVSLQMFGLLNFIVKKAITEPAELKGLYERFPAGQRLLPPDSGEDTPD